MRKIFTLLACGILLTACPKKDEDPPAAAPVTHLLNVPKSGTGSGTVTSSPAGIDCGTDCTQDYNSGTSVTLAATAAAGSTFTGWTGEGCSGPGNCTIIINSSKTVTANFVSGYFLTVSVTNEPGTNGTVTSSPGTINTGTTASEAFAANTVVTLTANMTTIGTAFDSWGGDCAGQEGSNCVLTMDGPKSVTANFIFFSASAPSP